MSPKKLGITGLFIAFVVALPLFVWTAINVNFNSNKRASEGTPNFCGGTCGSNYNCQANFYCFEGYCRNPLCSSDTDCVCNIQTTPPTATATLKSTIKPTIKPSPTATSEPKGGNDSYSDLINQTPKPRITISPTLTPYITPQPENQFLAKYAIPLFILFVIIVMITIYYAIRSNKKINNSQILPPTNI